jgi:hypothetical protein
MPGSPDDEATGAAGGAEADSDGTGPPEPRRGRPEGGDAEGPLGLDRRTLIRLLVGLGIGVPILIEAATLLGLLGDVFGGDDGDETPTPTDAPDGVTVGDELLPDTPATDTVRAAYVAADGWAFTLVVGVDNTTDRTYELRLRTVTTEDGRTVEGDASTGPVAPGESGSVTGRWNLPDGASPDTVDVVSVARDGTVTTVERTVQLGSVPVQGG